MNDLQNLIARYWATGSLVIIGLILIIYASFGFVYFQQGPRQREYVKQTEQLTEVVSKRLPDISELQADYDKVNEELAPLETQEIIDKLVEIAETSGINVSTSANKFLVPPAKPPATVTIGIGKYLVTTFDNIRVQGEKEAVMSFIKDLDSGTTLKNMVLTKLSVGSDVRVAYAGDEGQRRAEFRQVITAVQAMMEDNNLTLIPHPIDFGGNSATNLMGDDPDTPGTVEGFPDITTPPEERHYSGSATLRNGYVLYQHDRVNQDNTTVTSKVNYIPFLRTTYYYTCEADGTVRQYGGPSPLASREYFNSEDASYEMSVTLTVDIYTLPPKK